MGKDFLKAIIFISVIVTGITVITYSIGRQSCLEKWASFSPKFSFFGGCQIMVDGKYIPSENYKYMALDNKIKADEK